MDKESSSSDEENFKLQEALDPSMFHNQTKSSIIKDSRKSRNMNDKQNNILNVTPEFQSYIAKRLTDMLDKVIKECSEKSCSVNYENSGGIRLFTNSKKLLTDKRFKSIEDDSKVDKFNKKYRKRKFIEEDNYSERLEKARSAAVSPEWILEKKGVEGWCKPKGKEIKVVKNDVGELEVIDFPFLSSE